MAGHLPSHVRARVSREEDGVVRRLIGARRSFGYPRALADRCAAELRVLRSAQFSGLTGALRAPLLSPPVFAARSTRRSALGIAPGRATQAPEALLAATLQCLRPSARRSAAGRGASLRSRGGRGALLPAFKTGWRAADIAFRERRAAGRVRPPSCSARRRGVMLANTGGMPTRAAPAESVREYWRA